QPTAAGLLDFFRKRTPPAPERARLAGLAKQLGDREPAVRDRAAGELVSVGQAAVPVLREAANNIDDVEGAARARQCLQHIGGGGGGRLSGAAARLVAAQKPAGAAEVLLAYLPFAEDDGVVHELESALAAVGVSAGKPDPALLRALGDKVPVRRATA